MRVIFSILFIAVLFGCASLPNTTSFNVNSADFKKASNESLCAVYGFRLNRSEDARVELVLRKIFSQSEWQAIHSRQVLPGMSECAVLAAYSDSIIKFIFHKDTQGNVISKDFIYDCKEGRVPFCPYTQVKIRDGKVLSIGRLSSI